MGAPEWSRFYRRLDQEPANTWDDIARKVDYLNQARPYEHNAALVDQVEREVSKLLTEKERQALAHLGKAAVERLVPAKARRLMNLARLATRAAHEPRALLRVMEPTAIRRVRQLWALGRVVLGLSPAGGERQQRQRQNQRSRGGGMEL